TQAWSRRAGLASGGGHKRVLTHLSDLTLAWKCRQFETLPQTLSSAGDGPNWRSRRRSRRPYGRVDCAACRQDRWASTTQIAAIAITIATTKYDRKSRGASAMSQTRKPR